MHLTYGIHMSSLSEKIEIIAREIEQKISSATSLKELDDYKVYYVGRSGIVTELMASLKEMSLEEKRAAGPQLNALKQLVQTTYEQTAQRIEQSLIEEQNNRVKHFDVTAYYQEPSAGSLHIFSHIVQQLEDIFISMGYEVVDGPEVESSYYNFQTLNIPEDHPARDMHDTFWLNIPDMLLRTHTSNVQPRILESRKPPYAIFTTGRCFRNEATDASHDFMFMQGEVFFVDKHVSLANLFATARSFLQAFFEKDDLQIRMRPGYFPFVEPGIEIDATCPFCNSGCSTCKKSGWIELLGSGLIHPNVLRACNLDPNEYSGFAIGFGLTRLAMLKYGISDIRLFNSAKLSFLNQF